VKPKLKARVLLMSLMEQPIMKMELDISLMEGRLMESTTGLWLSRYLLLAKMSLMEPIITLMELDTSQMEAKLPV
jgi:hypothetical protein